MWGEASMRERHLWDGHNALQPASDWDEVHLCGGVIQHPVLPLIACRHLCCSALLGTVREVERLYNDAEQRFVCGSPASPQVLRERFVNMHNRLPALHNRTM